MVQAKLNCKKSLLLKAIENFIIDELKIIFNTTTSNYDLELMKNDYNNKRNSFLCSYIILGCCFKTNKHSVLRTKVISFVFNLDLFASDNFLMSAKLNLK